MTWTSSTLPVGVPANFYVSLRRILVPTALDKASAVALDYASALARRFGSELAVLYAFEDSDYAGSSVVEAKLLACFSALRLRHLEARLFLRPGPTSEQVKAVANALGADLVVTSNDYHRRFLSYLTHEETGILRVQGVPCPVVVVNAVVNTHEVVTTSYTRPCELEYYPLPNLFQCNSECPPFSSRHSNKPRLTAT